jgi:hypothetical protein
VLPRLTTSASLSTSRGLHRFDHTMLSTGYPVLQQRYTTVPGTHLCSTLRPFPQPLSPSWTASPRGESQPLGRSQRNPCFQQSKSAFSNGRRVCKRVTLPHPRAKSIPDTRPRHPCRKGPSNKQATPKRTSESHPPSEGVAEDVRNNPAMCEEEA